MKEKNKEKKTRGGRSPRTKGSSFEREIAKFFSEKLQISFKRVPFSGALSYLKGDVYAPEYLSDLLIECKRNKTEKSLNQYKKKYFNDLLCFRMDRNPLRFFYQGIEISTEETLQLIYTHLKKK